VLGIVFVILVIFFRRGLVGAIVDLYRLATRGRAPASTDPDTVPAATPAGPLPDAPAGVETAARPQRPVRSGSSAAPILEAIGLTRHYGGVIANSDIDFSVEEGELRGIIGPNGAGKSTFFKMLTCEVAPTSGRIVFDGQDITGMDVSDA